MACPSGKPIQRSRARSLPGKRTPWPLGVAARNLQGNQGQTKTAHIRADWLSLRGDALRTRHNCGIPFMRKSPHYGEGERFKVGEFGRIGVFEHRLLRTKGVIHNKDVSAPAKPARSKGWKSLPVKI